MKLSVRNFNVHSMRHMIALLSKVNSFQRKKLIYFPYLSNVWNKPNGLEANGSQNDIFLRLAGIFKLWQTIKACNVIHADVTVSTKGFFFEKGGCLAWNGFLLATQYVSFLIDRHRESSNCHFCLNVPLGSIACWTLQRNKPTLLPPPPILVPPGLHSHHMHQT